MNTLPCNLHNPTDVYPGIPFIVAYWWVHSGIPFIVAYWWVRPGIPFIVAYWWVYPGIPFIVAYWWMHPGIPFIVAYWWVHPGIPFIVAYVEVYSESQRLKLWYSGLFLYLTSVQHVFCGTNQYGGSRISRCMICTNHVIHINIITAALTFIGYHNSGREYCISTAYWWVHPGIPFIVAYWWVHPGKPFIVAYWWVHPGKPFIVNDQLINLLVNVIVAKNENW